MIFKDRTQAAELLSKKLQEYHGQNPLVLAIPRGAVPMGKVLADLLDGDLDVVLVHKIGAPDNPEYAIGSVSEFGSMYFTDVAEAFGSREDLELAARGEIEKLKKRRASYTPIHAPISPRGRKVIIVDDGIATGSTMIAAVRAINEQGAREVVVAAPVASPRAISQLRREADEVVVLDAPEDFYAISQFYDNFEQVTDEEVVKTLGEGTQTAGRRVA